ncbi:ribosome biogenesis protein NOC1-like [Hyalella azteca]|uniref:Ribosome biogenesis protein NOC1-like n=1 Tax=Hyalella azteca TaxID=294128 RepID=A0A8B7NZB5_HYAAZ|nr:ribosome biogenesis protein NOC1-like [Hyalella azteca]
MHIKGTTYDNPPDEDSTLLKKKRQRIKKEKKIIKRQNKKTAIQDQTISSSSEVAGEDSHNECPESAEPQLIKNTRQEKSLAFSALWNNYIPMPTMLARQDGWYLEIPIEVSAPKAIVNIETRTKLKEFAAELYKNELVQYEKYEENSGDRDIRFRRQIFAQGAMKDRITAHILQLTEWPVQSLSHLAKLCDFVSANKESHLKEILKSLTEVLNNSLLPKGLVAKQFEEHDFKKFLQPLITTDRQKAYTILMLWYYEDQLKLLYTRLVTALKQVVSSGSPSAKLTAVQLLLQMLGNHPKQETEIILQVLTNKLGDLDKSVANAVIFGVRNLIIRRPALKNTLVDVCAEFLFRPNQRKNTQLNCIQLLKDVFFTKDDVGLVQKMIRLYFGFFKACTKTGEVDGKLMSAILRGLNRALPYATNAKGREGSSFLEEQFNMLYKIVHFTKFNISVQILQLLYQVLVNMNPDGALPERYERVLYERLLCPELSRCAVAGAFLNVVFKTMSRMQCPQTLTAFAKRLLQISFYQPSHLAIAMVFVLRETAVDNALLRDFLRKIDARKPTRLPSAKASMQAKKPVVRNNSAGSYAEPDEFFYDLDVEANDKKGSTSAGRGKKNSSRFPHMVGKVELKKSASDDRESGSAGQRRPTRNDEPVAYDAHHRNPKYSGADTTQVWELRNALNHFHPSLVAFTKNLVENEHTKYAGDPLIDYSLIKFLDRFVNKAPKKITKTKTGGGAAALGAKSAYSGDKKRTSCVTSDYFLSLPEHRVPADALFFHKYFTSHKARSSRAAKSEQDDDECEDLDEEEFERYLESAAGKKGVTQNPFQHDDELDDEWDFAANAKARGNRDDDDSDLGSDVSDVDEEEEGNENQSDDALSFDGDQDDVEDLNDLDDENFSDDDSRDDSGDDFKDDDEADFGDEFDDLDDAEDHGHMFLDDEEMEEKPQQARKKIEKKLKAVADKNKRAKQAIKNERVRESAQAEKKNKSVKSTSDKKKSSKRKRDNDEWTSLDGNDSGDDFGLDSRKMKKLDDMVFGKRKERSARSLDDMMMDADEFTELLQSNEIRAPAITSSDFVNTSGISQNQLRWERAHASDRLNIKTKKSVRFSGSKVARSKARNGKKMSRNSKFESARPNRGAQRSKRGRR